MDPIPKPSVLDPDRVLSDTREGGESDPTGRAAKLHDALQDSCAYATQLWNDLNAIREYLMDSLPPDPRAPGLHPTASAAPTGPDDDEGWTAWITAYAAVTSALAGPHGDSGYGLSQARHAAQTRRTAPVLTILAAHREPAPPPAAPPEAAVAAGTQAKRTGTQLARTAGTVALVLLALRGLRPRRSR